jgi:hypothetical protein
METIVKKLLLAAIFASALTAGAFAQTYDPSIPPRDPAFGKGNADNDTFHLPSQAGASTWGRAYGSMSYGETAKAAHRPDRR